MQIISLIGHSAELFRIINKSRQPADLLTKQYLKSKKYLGSHDRKFISGVVFTALRIKSYPDYFSKFLENQHSSFAADMPEEERMKFLSFFKIIISIVAANQLNIKYPGIDILSQANFPAFIDGTVSAVSEKFSLSYDDVKLLIEQLSNRIAEFIAETDKIAISGDLRPDDLFALSIRYAQQEWILKILIESNKYSSQELRALLDSLFYPAPLTIRINAGKEKREAILQECRKFDETAKPTEFSPFGIHLSKRFDLNTIPLYKQGLIEVQDEGSQLITTALSPGESDTILDACAGAGGKTMHIASLTNNKSTIIASDIELRKLKELNKRARRAQFTSVTTYLPKHIEKSGIKKFSKVLIDAPCSGMGTVRRSPMLKWLLTPALLEKYNKKQYRILKQYSEYVMSGGILLYATCSILPNENEKIVERFLNDTQEFSPAPLKPAFDNLGIQLPGLNGEEFQYQLLPSVHGTDGFYFAKFIKE